jgi:hypothetical protein
LLWLAGMLGIAHLVGHGHRFIMLLCGLFWPVVAGFIAWFSTGLLTIPFPRIRFSTKNEVDGFGYVHQPYDVLIPFWMISIVIALVAAVRRGR